MPKQGAGVLRPSANTEPQRCRRYEEEKPHGAKPPLKEFRIVEFAHRLNGLDHAGENSNRDRNVTNGNQDSDDFGECLAARACKQDG